MPKLSDFARGYIVAVVGIYAGFLVFGRAEMKGLVRRCRA